MLKCLVSGEQNIPKKKKLNILSPIKYCVFISPVQQDKQQQNLTKQKTIK